MRKGLKWGIVGLVLVSCCLLGVIVRAVGGPSSATNNSSTVADQAAEVAVMPTEQPTERPTVKPRPTVDTFAACKDDVYAWKTDTMVVINALTESMQMVANADLVTAYKRFEDVKLMYTAVAAPICDDDAMSIHERVAEVLDVTEDAFRAMARGDFATSTEKLKEAGSLANKMSGTMESINRKYGW